MFTPTHPHPTHTSTLPSPLVLYPTLLGYVRLRKDVKYGGVVLGKNRFNNDIPLNLNLNSLLVKRQIDNPSPGAVTGGN